MKAWVLSLAVVLCVLNIGVAFFGGADVSSLFSVSKEGT